MLNKQFDRQKESPRLAESNDMAGEIAYRIQADAKHFDGVLPEKYAIAWRGYLAALLEWNLISNLQYEALLDHIPPIEDDPAVAILRGRD
jgi:hypothetical protein